MTFTNPRPPAELASNYYQSQQYISHSSKSNGIIDSIYLIIRQFTNKWKYNLVKPLLHNKPLLDYGCGTGTFAILCKSKGVSVYGLEPSLEARTKASENINVVESLDQLPPTKFSVITLWHVLEHVYDLNETIQRLKSLLEETGTIFIAVPNLESEDAIHYRENWAAYDVPRHLWHFSEATMKLTLEKNELKIVSQIPMKLDSYYVSLLSEKNSNKNQLTLTAIFKGLYNGYHSNYKAKERMNYSSIIYVVQK